MTQPFTPKHGEKIERVTTQLCHKYYLPKDDFFSLFSVEQKSQVQCMDLGGFV